jgi:inosine-uridine nucleoside N-ribohydrolase
MPIILDTDPGHDDAFALLLAARAPELKLLAVTTVAGNQTLDKTSLNARRVMTVGRVTGVPAGQEGNGMVAELSRGFTFDAADPAFIGNL